MMHLPLRMLRKGSANRQMILPLAIGAVFLLAGLAQCLLLGVFLSAQNTPFSDRSDTLVLSYSDFAAQVQANNVAWVTLDDTTGHVDGGLRHPIVGKSVQGIAVTSVDISSSYLPRDTSALHAQLQEHGVQVLSAPPDSATSGPPALLIAGVACGGFLLCTLVGGAALFLGILRVMARRNATTMDFAP